MQSLPKLREYSPKQQAAALLIATLKISERSRPWERFLRQIFPDYVKHPFAQRHKDLWEWIESINADQRPQPFVGIWPRGGAKSTSAELGVVRIGARRVRHYAWYVSGTQDKADQHVDSIAGLLENSNLAAYDSELGSRLLGKYGNSKGWRRSRLRTMSGLTIDAFGLDTGMRGAKVDQYRPDLIIIDDVDDETDTLKTVLKKIQVITSTVLPAGTPNCAVLFIQNVVHVDSIAMRLIDGRTDFLADRILSGPYPAIENMVYEQRDGKFYVIGGTPTWEGQTLATCQDQIFTWGFSAFMREAQHEVEKAGGVWDHVEFQHIEFDQLPTFIRKSVWVDPAVTSTDKSDCQGISAGGLTTDKKMIGLYWWEGIDAPGNAVNRAIRKAVEIGATKVGIETDQGGDTWKTVFDVELAKIQKEFVARLTSEQYGEIVWPKFDSDKAGHGYGSKIERNARMLASYENGRIIHMSGTHNAIEKSLRRFPGEPLDLADSHFWLWNDLLGNNTVRMAVAST